jgi:PAS domain S-box-containing protein
MMTSRGIIMTDRPTQPIDKTRFRPLTPEATLTHLQALVNAVGCIVWEGDPDTYAFTFVSDQAEKLLGYPASRWLEEPSFWADHIHPDDRDRVLGFCVEATRGGKNHAFEYRMIAADGREVWLKDIVTVLTEDGAPVWSQGVMIDITERKRLELALQAQNTHLRELDQLKNELVNTASHELRTPLASIKGYVEFLEDEVAGPLMDGQRTFVAQIQQGVDRLQHIIDDMLDFARLEAGELTLARAPVDLGRLVRAATESLRPQAQRAGLSLSVSVPEQPLDLSLDGPRIEQVVLNLVGNAIKFTPAAGGSIAVTVAATPEGARVAVCDSGIGLASEHHARVFEKFYQVDASTTRPYGGAGLGLAIAKSLVEAHGGTIGVDSDGPDCPGATFWFTLPRIDS